jgi:hypothetical protein
MRTWIGNGRLHINGIHYRKQHEGRREEDSLWPQMVVHKAPPQPKISRYHAGFHISIFMKFRVGLDHAGFWFLHLPHVMHRHKLDASFEDPGFRSGVYQLSWWRPLHPNVAGLIFTTYAERQLEVTMGAPSLSLGAMASSLMGLIAASRYLMRLPISKKCVPLKW